MDPSAPSWTARHPRSPDFSDLSPSPPTVLESVTWVYGRPFSSNPSSGELRAQDTPGLRRRRRRGEWCVRPQLGGSCSAPPDTSAPRAQSGSPPRPLAAESQSSSAALSPAETPGVRRACPAGSSCCAPVQSRRLSSKAAPRAPVRAGAGLLATVPGERLRANESEREDRAAPAQPRPHITHRRRRDTRREGGREEKHRVTERQMD